MIKTKLDLFCCMKYICLFFSDVFIVGVARTPMGGFRGSLSSLPAPRLGALAIEAALERANCPKEAVEEVYMGAVLQVHEIVQS